MKKNNGKKSDSQKSSANAAPASFKLPKHSIPQDEVIIMAEHYNDLVLKDPKIAIQQIWLNGFALKEILIWNNVIKLIAGAYPSPGNVTTMIIQLKKDGDFIYYDINKIKSKSKSEFKVLGRTCPPPTPCGIPFCWADDDE